MSCHMGSYVRVPLEDGFAPSKIFVGSETHVCGKRPKKPWWYNKSLTSQNSQLSFQNDSDKSCVPSNSQQWYLIKSRSEDFPLLLFSVESDHCGFTAGPMHYLLS